MASLEEEYRSRFPLLENVAQHLKAEIEELLLIEFERIDQITARAKDPADFLEKASRINSNTGEPKYTHPLDDIQDQIGVRVVAYYTCDREEIRPRILKAYNEIQDEKKSPSRPDQFSYEARHIICMIPPDLRASLKVPIDSFELQVCTLFQHAWAEANHDLGYKGENELEYEQERLLGLAAAQAWGADWIFEKLWTVSTSD